jgi:hypothetical protein
MLQRIQATKAKAEAVMQPAAFRDVSVPLPWLRPKRLPRPNTLTAPRPSSMPSSTPTEPCGFRAEGGLPKRLDFRPPDPAIVDAIINDTSPIMRALDQAQHAAAMV